MGIHRLQHITFQVEKFNNNLAFQVHDYDWPIASASWAVNSNELSRISGKRYGIEYASAIINIYIDSYPELASVRICLGRLATTYANRVVTRMFFNVETRDAYANLVVDSLAAWDRWRSKQLL